MTSDNLDQLTRTLAAMVADLSPANCRKTAMAIATKLRNSNAERIGRNVSPDGEKFEPRKIQKTQSNKKSLRTKSGKIKAKAAMFQKLKKLRHLTRRATSDSAIVGFLKNSTARIALVSQYGQTDRILRNSNRKVKYPVRQLLGFGPEDLNEIMDTASDLLQQLK